MTHADRAHAVNIVQSGECCLDPAQVPAPVTEQFPPTAVPLPAGVDGLAVLDLACGSGRDSYVAAVLVCAAML